MRAAAARYRERKRAEAKGETIPPEAAHRRQAPIVTRAAARAAAARFRRNEVVESLPNIRNLEGGDTLYVPRDRQRGKGPGAIPFKSTRGGQQRQAQAITENENARKLQVLGRSRKQQLVDELNNSQNSERLQSAMNPEQQARFQRLSEAIAKNNQQSLALLFTYAGGSGDYSGVLEAILASPESRDVELGLARLSVLAKLAQQAAELYSPSRIGRLNV